jgi:hypothetical protein
VGELEDAFISKGKKPLGRLVVKADQTLSVRDLAGQAGLYHQRVNEAIQTGKLRANWRMGRLWVDLADAESS